jgi:hypothetical protein
VARRAGRGAGLGWRGQQFVELAEFVVEAVGGERRSGGGEQREEGGEASRYQGLVG